jgi:hypothetical protein
VKVQAQFQPEGGAYAGSGGRHDYDGRVHDHER